MRLSIGRFPKKTTKHPVIWIFVIAAAIAAYILGNTDNSVTEGQIEIHFIDVGQGDSALILTDTGSVLIDAGTTESGEKVAAYVKSRTDSIDYMVLSHPHEDHIGGAAAVFETLSVKEVIMPDKTADSAAFDRLLDCIEESGAKVNPADQGSVFTLGELEMRILSPFAGVSYEETNDVSVVMRVIFGNTSFMFTGDAEALVEKDLIEMSSLLDSDVLKVGHHGSSTSSTMDFLEAVSPEIAVISCGKDNSYGHPHAEVVERLEKLNAEIYRTDRLGTIVVTSDGDTVTVK